MNITTLYHFTLFFVAALCYGRVNVWAFLVAAILLIEIDQAMTYTGWAWFATLDTWCDIAAGLAGVWAARILSKYI